MFKLLGIIFLLLLIEFPIVLLDQYIGNGFLKSFILNQSLPIMATLLGFNIASSTFLMGYFSNIEIARNKSLFSATKSEMKQNIYLMLIVLLFHLIVIIFTPKVDAHTSKFIQDIANWCLRTNLFLFLLYLFTVYDMTGAIFIIDGYLKKGNSKSNRP